MRCVPAHDFTVGKMMLWRSAMNENPPYQRESSVWSLGKQQLFVDSLLNGFDIPKIYLDDLRGKHPTKVYAVVDGKQRLTTLWRFLADGFPLAAEFSLADQAPLDLPPGTPPPLGGMRFSQFHPVWQEVVKTTFLSVVLIRDATEVDIEELFYRLNNGEPLNAAERRNAMGGDMARLIRDVAGRPFFTHRVRLANERYVHRDIAARVLLIEHAYASGTAPDLRSGVLDEFVQDTRSLPEADRAALVGRVDRWIGFLEEVFTDSDPLLSTQALPPLYYLFARSIPVGSAVETRPAAVRQFLERFQSARRAELDKPADQQDGLLAEFSRLGRDGVFEPDNLARRAAILCQYFGRAFPGVA